MCSFQPRIQEWAMQKHDLSGGVAQAGPVSMPAHTSTPVSIYDGPATSTSARPSQHGPMYSAKWYKPPLDDRSLAKDANGMIAVREELRGIRARVAYDIKKLSMFAGDGGSEEEDKEKEEKTLEDYEPNPFYDSQSECGEDIGSAHARSEKDESGDEQGDVDSLGVGAVDLNSDDVDDDVSGDDVGSDVFLPELGNDTSSTTNLGIRV
ncbi:uncharacterized protein PGRI_007410 [Penicillium griseofulvum]|uniref:Uncharacterized protein n=1 Tax=Penicillium patulum TaxID=5078 RepID=A0A135LXQ0_PENPA|nr:uncharacterized protein PGRI_007410 [Penicillium griseofulvum]KXG53691.1 hypothetical protein PGRI_007410 [Penicillium griseofulvum]